MDRIAILGNGISGITAARHIRKLDPEVGITVISSESKYFYSRTSLMYIFMGHMKFEHTKPYEDWFWEKNRIQLILGHINEINFNQNMLVFDDGEEVIYDKLIIAVGSKSNRFDWPGQDLQGVQGLNNLQDLELLEINSRDVKHAVIVGGGLIGVELAEMLHSRGIEVTFLIRETGFWQNVLPQEEADLIGRHLQDHGIKLLLETNLKEIVSSDNKSVSCLITDKGEEIECQFVGLTVGVSPNVDFLRNSDLNISKGVRVNEYLETNIPNVYALGDCVEIENPQNGRKAIEPVWYTGRMMGETVAKTITGNKTPYQPGVWFNSAKFFDIEYQTYGNVANHIEEGTDHFYWENQDGDKSFRLVYENDSNVVKGMNSFGLRWRHEFFDQWINEKATLSQVLSNLDKANFDPEFFNKYQDSIVEYYNIKNPGTPVEIKRKRKKFLNLF